MRHTITLQEVKGTWMATFSDPAVAALVGSKTIPTAFTTATPYEAVHRTIQTLNPQADLVRHWPNQVAQ